MKKIFSIIAIAMVLSVIVASCKKSSFEEAYRNPAKVSTSTVEKQYSGMVNSFKDYILPSYWNYFVVLRTSLVRYTQAVGWENSPGQYQPPAAGLSDRWNSYYNLIAQYRELQKIHDKLPENEKAEKRVFMLTAAIFIYDQTQKVVDLHGDIPFQTAGMLSTNNGDYSASYAKYDRAEDLYTMMLDDLKGFSDELSTLNLSPATQTVFQTQDLINKGDIELWKRYCNSLRLRMLTRVSSTSNFKARYDQEVAAIVSNPSSYPIVTTNDQNIAIRVYDLTTGGLTGSGFQGGLEDWDGNLAGKAMIDHMKTNADPRLRAVFEPGENADGQYLGLDPLMKTADQTKQFNAGLVSIYNRSTISRNQFFPGILITATEVDLLISEYYLSTANNAGAETAYNNGIQNSVEFYYGLRDISNNSTSPVLVPTNNAEIDAYRNSAGIKWSNAANNQEKLKRIATEKWIHFNVVQPLDNWAELRRLDAPQLSFQVDNSATLKAPPMRWVYPASELAYNSENYQAVQANDNATTKIFWDTQ